MDIKAIDLLSFTIICNICLQHLGRPTRCAKLLEKVLVWTSALALQLLTSNWHLHDAEFMPCGLVAPEVNLQAAEPNWASDWRRPAPPLEGRGCRTSP